MLEAEESYFFFVLLSDFWLGFPMQCPIQLTHEIKEGRS